MPHPSPNNSSSSSSVWDEICKVGKRVKDTVIQKMTTTEEGPSLRLRRKIPPPFASSNKKRKKKPGEEAFRKLIEYAEYEVQQDPYRGIAETTTTTESPWRACVLGGGASSSADNPHLVEAVCQCSCPTLIAWTNDRKKTKHLLGKRPTDPSLRCACDYNPFCLGTLGGVMDEVLEQRRNEFDDGGGDSGTDNEVLVLDGEEDRYSKETRKKLLKVRKASRIDRRPVETYLQQILDNRDVQEYLEAIQKWHDSLAFSNPLNEKDLKATNNHKLRISVPPGIENLGATCYLNTQLQCLAQNRVFVQGILSWSHNNNDDDHQDDAMMTVIRSFQQLLGRMHAGPHNVLNTVELSNALGLDHHEQQDPNEFSRLFLDKMHESFQRTAGCEELLPDLFQGMTTYETVCLTCQTKSRRNEEFMDVNLPIVPRPKPAPGQPSLLQTFAAAKDTDVQLCLDQYCSPETLEGENQYHCSHCGCKRDATRQLIWGKLPPVLNVQLSRYVFDMKTYMKRKVEDKVILPLQLAVDDKTYILTAIMRHQGKSAYSGHYVAEAMDWQTGRWFAFNDEVVTYLEKGPSCSWDGGRGAAPPPAGSSDAYNMYYVEKSFLAQSVLESCRVTTATVMAKERENMYSELVQLCLEDIKDWNTLEERRKGIRDVMLGRLFAPRPADDGEWVWVDRVELQNFLSCRREMLTPKLVKPQLCRHKKLHPRMARRGKLLPREMYDAYVVLLSKAARKEIAPNPVLTPSNLVCRDCANEYHLDLASKLDILRTARRLYETLDPKDDSFTLKATDRIEHDSDRYAFIVSRKFITQFRIAVAKLMKACLVLDAPAPLDEMLPASTNLEALAEGLDAFDLSCVTQTIEGEAESSWPQGEIVNGSITCMHGNCKLKIKRSIRYVPWNVWIDIHELFPSAVEHKRLRFGPEDSGDDAEIIFCSDCEKEAEETDSMRNQISSVLQSSPNFQPCDVVSEDKENTTELYRILYREDLDIWKKFIGLAKRRIAKGTTDFTEQVRNTLHPLEKWSDNLLSVDLLSGSSHDADVARELSGIIRPMACQKHKLPIQEALFHQKPDDPSLKYLHSSLCMVSEEEYQDMVATWAAVIRIVFPLQDENEEPTVATEGARRLGSNLKWLHPVCRRHRFVAEAKKRCHFVVASDSLCVLFDSETEVCNDPVCNAAYSSWRKQELHTREELDKKKTSIIVKEVEKAPEGAASHPISIDCDYEPPATAGSVSMRVYEAESGSTIDSILSDLSLSTAANATRDASQTVRRSSRRRKQRLPIGSIIAEDSVQVKVENNVAALRLLLLERCASGSPFQLSHKLRLVIPCFTGSADAVVDKLAGDALKGDASLPPAVIAENGDAGKGISDSVSPGPATFPKVVDLSLDVSKHVLEDVIMRSLGAAIKDVALTFSDILILRQSEEDPDITSIPKDALLDHMIGLAGISEADTTERKKKKRKTSVEKGFTGTLLSSRRGPEAAAAVGQGSTEEKAPSNHDLPGDPCLDTDDMKQQSDLFPQQGKADHVQNGASDSRVSLRDTSSRDVKRAKLSSCEGEEKKELTPHEIVGEDEMEIEIFDTICNGTVKSNTHSMDDSNKRREGRTLKLAQCLLESPDVDNAHESFCFDAAKWALSQIGDMPVNDQELIEKAYDKYIDIVFNSF